MGAFLGIARKRTYTYTAADNELTLQFKNVSQNAKINGIQITQIGGPTPDFSSPNIVSITVENPIGIQDGTRKLTVILSDDVGFDAADFAGLDGSELSFSGIVPESVSVPVITLGGGGVNATLVYTLEPPAASASWPTAVGEVTIEAGAYRDASGKLSEQTTAAFLSTPNGTPALIDATDALVEEGGTAIVTFTRTGDLSEAVTVNYSLSFGLGNKADATDVGTPTPASPVIIAANQSTATVSIPIVNDMDTEGAESFSVVIDSVTTATGNALIAPGGGVGTVTIRASDQPIQVPGTVLLDLDFETPGNPLVEGGFDGALGGTGAIVPADAAIADGNLIVQTADGDINAGGTSSKNDFVKTLDFSDPSLEQIYVTSRFTNPFTEEVLGAGVTAVPAFAQQGVVVGTGTQNSNELLKLVWGGVAGGSTGIQFWSKPVGGVGITTAISLAAMVPGATALDIDEIELSIALDRTGAVITAAPWVTLFDFTGEVIGGVRPTATPGFLTSAPQVVPAALDTVLRSNAAKVGVTSNDFGSLASYEAAWEFLTITSPQLLPSAALTGATSASEGDTASYSVSLDASPGSQVQVTVNLTAGSIDPASLPADAVLTSGGTQATLTFDAGATGPALTQTFTVTIVDDTLPELPETFSVSISSATATITGPASITTTIAANDGPVDSFNGVNAPAGDFSGNGLAPTDIGVLALQPGTNTLIASQQGDSEPGGRDRDYVTFEVPVGTVLSQILLQNYVPGEFGFPQGFIGIDDGPVITLDPTTVAGGSVDLLGGYVYNTGDVNSDILDDLGSGETLGSTFDGFTPPLSAGVYTLWLNQGGPSSRVELEFVVTNQPNNEVTIAASADGAEAGPLNGSFTVSLTEVAATDTTVSYSVSGTATAGDDYTALSGSVVIAAGETSAVIDVTVLDDLLVEGAESVIVTLTGATGDGNIALGTTTEATITISDNDPVVQNEVTIAASADGAEAGPLNGSFTVSLTEVAATDTTVSYSVSGTATAGDDYTALSGSVVIAAGETSAVIDVTVLDDLLVEGAESVIVTLTGATGDGNIALGTTIDATITISDNDPVVQNEVTIAASADGAEAGPLNGSFTVSLTEVATTDTTVSYTVSGTATAGDDYTALSGSVVIAAGETSAVIDVTVLDDLLVEGDESVIVTLTGATGDGNIALGTTTEATITISDNDPVVQNEVTIAASADGAEAGPLNGSFTVSLTEVAATDTTVSYTVSGTATAGDDYTALSGSVVIAAGETSAVIDVTVLDDLLVEGAESVIVTLTGATGDGNIALGTTTEATITISDNDPVVQNEVTIAASADGAEAGPLNGSFTVSLTRRRRRTRR